jgi:hypothetical protein
MSEGMVEVRKKRFFFEKKKQKTFANCGLCAGQRQMLQLTEVFLLLFLQKKKCLLCFFAQWFLA